MKLVPRITDLATTVHVDWFDADDTTNGFPSLVKSDTYYFPGHPSLSHIVREVFAQEEAA